MTAFTLGSFPHEVYSKLISKSPNFNGLSLQMGFLLKWKLIINYDEWLLLRLIKCILLSNWCWWCEISCDPCSFPNIPKSWILLMNWLEVMSVLIVRLVLTMLFHSWTVYFHVFVGLNLFLEEFMGISLTLTMKKIDTWLGFIT